MDKMKKTSKHIANGIAKALRTPMFKMQVRTDRKKQERKSACRRPVRTMQLPETV